MRSHVGQEKKFLDVSGRDRTYEVENYRGSLTAKELLDSLRVYPYIETIHDTLILGERDILETVRERVDVYRNPILPQLKDYPLDIFFDYILPYRVGMEKYHDWRTYMKNKYVSYLATFSLETMSIKDISQAITLEQEGFGGYASNRKLQVNRPSRNQTVHQIQRIKMAFDCEDFAIRSLYAHRAVGIPAAYEIIPLWGKFNYGHVQASVFFEDGKFYPIQFGDTVPFKYQIAKMYRRTFRSQVNPFHEIRKLGEQEYNIPSIFNHSDWIDVTSERTDVADVAFENRNYALNVAYIAVYNAGYWKPIEWSKLERTSDSFIFCAMGAKILYQIVGYRKGSMLTLGAPFALNVDGKLDWFKPVGRRVKAKLHYSDRHTQIQENSSYILYCWDSQVGRWQQIQRSKAKNSYFETIKIDVGNLYKLESDNVNLGDPVRPFTVNAEGQKWW
ncbi:hypothetical protein [Pedobacter faecalis]|uniref:hypothetical protein n=1 Tax=Pedobacter faecalis TaxID=3041495 RepID=UPI002550EEF4|nr:hypothetical protein [Pedobacter sp. ELA7]